MLISHEVPIELLEKSLEFNDYDYCLLHLTFNNDKYTNFYINNSNNGRKILLDNSLFELGDSLSQEAMIEGIKRIKPTWYVVPDCLNNKEETIRRFEQWKKTAGNLCGLKIGVVQGSTIEELIDCYKYMSKNADKIAIPFDSKAFEIYKEDNVLKTWCEGRKNFIKLLVDKGLWNNEKPHHLLGCSLAEEFSEPLYRSISIESIDTSNPVVTGCLEIKYGDKGLSYKPSIKLCELIDLKLNSSQVKCILHNVRIFRKLTEGQI